MALILHRRRRANARGGRDVQDFGATGNGVTDDTTALQNALDSGDPLYLHPGTYLISDALVYDNGTELAGDPGRRATIQNTTTRTGTTEMLAPNGLGITDTLFQDFVLDQRGDVYDAGGDAPTDHLMSVNATTDAKLYRILFRNARTMAVWADAFPADPTTGTIVQGCEITSAGGGGFSFFGEFSGFDISGNVVTGTQDDAIAVQSTSSASSDGLCSDGVISNNVIRDCDTQTSYDSTPHGIMVFGAADVVVAGNDIDSTYASGIQVSVGGGKRATNVDVLNNKIRDAGTNNNGLATPAYGLFLLNADYVTLAGNDVASCLHGNYFASGCTNITKDF